VKHAEKLAILHVIPLMKKTEKNGFFSSVIEKFLKILGGPQKKK
jgi:hypothetical protein